MESMERETSLTWRFIRVVAGLSLIFGLTVIPSPSAASEFGPKDIERAKEAYSSDSIADQVSRLETRAWVEFPDTFAGLWINDGDYREIFVSFSQAASRSADRLVGLEGFGDHDALRIVKVEYSFSQLEEAQKRLTQHRDFLNAQRDDLTKPVSIANYGTGIDVKTNKLQIFAQGEAKEYVSELAKSQLDVPFEVIDGDPGSPFCGGRWQCGKYLRGGLGTWHVPKGDPAGAYVRCTLAFTARRGSARPILSAGHCGDNRNTGANDVGNQRFYGTGTPGTLFGSVQDQRKGGRADAERISVGNGFHAHPWIYRTHDTPHWAITSRGTWAGFTIGQTFCKAGIITGYSCGTAADKAYDGAEGVAGANRFLRVINQSATYGDSGAPLFQQHQAVGILHGGSPEAGAVYGHIQYAEEHLGVVVDTM